MRTVTIQTSLAAGCTREICVPDELAESFERLADECPPRESRFEIAEIAAAEAARRIEEAMKLLEVAGFVAAKASGEPSDHRAKAAYFSKLSYRAREALSPMAWQTNRIGNDAEQAVHLDALEAAGIDPIGDL